MKLFYLFIFIPFVASAQTANDLVQAYLSQNGKTAIIGDYQTCQPQGQPDQLCTWNVAHLGVQPTAAQLQALAATWMPPVHVPVSVTRAQALAALSDAGLLTQAQAAVAAATDPHVTIFWNNAQTFERASTTINTIGAALGLTSIQIDALFIAAAKIQL